MDENQITQDLRKKGWTEEEIAQAVRGMQDAVKSKGRFTRFLDQIVYWFFLMLTLLGNFIATVVLVPFMLLVAQPVLLYPVVVVVAVSFGALMDNIIQDILDIPNAQKIMPELFLPAIALMSVYIMVRLNNEIAMVMQLPYGIHEPIIMGIFYTSGFMLPYYFTWQKKKAAQAPPPPPSFQAQ